MGLDSATLKLKAGNDALEAKQKAGEVTAERLRATRRMSRHSIDRIDHTLGRLDIARGIDEVLPKLTAEAVPDAALRMQLELLLTAAREHLR